MKQMPLGSCEAIVGMSHNPVGSLENQHSPFEMKLQENLAVAGGRSPVFEGVLHECEENEGRNPGLVVIHRAVADHLRVVVEPDKLQVYVIVDIIDFIGDCHPALPGGDVGVFEQFGEFDESILGLLRGAYHQTVK